ncbi:MULTISPECIES: methionine ABC transporter permease [Carnobacterium]|jgi:D-methionine transport system permease protein|uniref:D-methionine transport system permease protein n=1 Tax=Carnobacterium alterfunditum TaxID=28230 RepID=A0A1N6FSI3_9LACT|nr:MULTISPECIES: methionine ABC transporter permease [Carnobacterium]MBT2732198.1 ABC transporter permease [Carnobacterium sp. ISL-102]SIN98198.1 D-methionine transport system permease protein [Carnobacterium alterfunditum]
MLLKLNFGTSVLSQYLDFAEVDWEKMQQATIETIFMTIGSVVIIFFAGLLLGLLLYETNGKNTLFAKILYRVVAILVNVFRSIPFIILIVLLIPITKTLVGSIIGPTAALPALILSSAPFFARLVEIGFREIDKGVVEAAEAMGASKWEIIYKVLIPESLPAIVSGITVTTISLVGATAMAGVIGAGGLGNLAYLDGFQRNQPAVTLVSTLIILVLVFIIQAIGDVIVKKVDKR